MDSTQLRVWRKAQGMTQQRLAEQLGVSRRTVINWEAGGQINHGRMLGLACQALGKEKPANVGTTLTGKPYGPVPKGKG
jgi:transcriptional regulator with XRE-family HTH domain